MVDFCYFSYIIIIIYTFITEPVIEKDIVMFMNTGRMAGSARDAGLSYLKGSKGIQPVEVLKDLKYNIEKGLNLNRLLTDFSTLLKKKNLTLFTKLPLLLNKVTWWAQKAANLPYI